MKSLGSTFFNWSSIPEQFPCPRSVGFVWSTEPFQECSVGRGVGLSMAGQWDLVPWLWDRGETSLSGTVTEAQQPFVGFQRKCPSCQRKEVRLEKLLQ